jgi:hypothetical protein
MLLGVPACAAVRVRQWRRKRSGRGAHGRRMAMWSVAAALSCFSRCSSSGEFVAPSAMITDIAGTYQFTATPSKTCDPQQANALSQASIGPLPLTQSGASAAIGPLAGFAFTFDLSGTISGNTLTFTFHKSSNYSVLYYRSSGSGTAVIARDAISGTFAGGISDVELGGPENVCHATDHGFLLKRIP